ncbi:MAG: hypothetical protein IT159_09615 [Bryobacterales bacterium]|nr:hypothetical protein [Bryobacterales bacterium]
MLRRRISTGLALSVCLAAAHGLAQTSRTDRILQDKAAKAAGVKPEERERGDVIITRLERFFFPEPPALRLTLGDFRAGAGLGGGAAYAVPAGRALWTTRAAWSVKNYRQLQSVLELPPAAGDRVRVVVFAKWDEAPDLPYFGVGNSSSRANEVSYGLRTVDAGVGLRGRAARHFLYGGSVGYFGAHSSEGAGPEPSIGRLFFASSTPGLGSAPTWVHAGGFAAYDTRESPGYTRRGALYSLALHRYADRGGQFSFDRAEVDLRQFIPVVHDNWVIALQGRAELTGTAAGQAVPYFMLPAVGGRDTLPGFGQYRFADRHSLLLRSELRWAASPLVDMAVIFDEGKVAAKRVELGFGGLKRSVGFGVRFHGPTFTALRVDVARSAEGWRFNITHGFSF